VLAAFALFSSPLFNFANAHSWIFMYSCSPLEERWWDLPYVPAVPLDAAPGLIPLPSHWTHLRAACLSPVVRLQAPRCKSFLIPNRRSDFPAAGRTPWMVGVDVAFAESPAGLDMALRLWSSCDPRNILRALSGPSSFPLCPRSRAPVISNVDRVPRPSEP